MWIIDRRRKVLVNLEHVVRVEQFGKLTIVFIYADTTHYLIEYADEAEQATAWQAFAALLEAR